jgi:hypothetical protein
MCPSITVALALGWLLPAAAPAKPGAANPVVPQFEIRADEISNLVYQLDCLPSGKECAFERLWKDQLGWTAEDDAALARRRQIVDRYQWRVTIDDKLDDGPLMFDASRTVELGKKLKLAAAGAHDIASYRARLELVVTSSDAFALAAITERFLPRFRRFFARLRPTIDHVARELEPQLASPAVVRVLGQAVAFYQTPASGHPRLQVQLIALPPDWTGHTAGEQVETLSLVETSLRPPPDRNQANSSATAKVIIHELSHYFYGSVPGEQARALALAFAASKDPAAAAAYGLVNEALACAVAVVAHKAALTAAEWQRELAGGLHSYNDVPIDTAAKAIWPWIEERLTDGLSLYEPSFVPTYLRLVRAAMGPALDQPALRLRTLVAVVDDDQIRGRLPGIPSGRVEVARPLAEAEVRDLLVKHRDQSAVFKVRGAHLPALQFWATVLGEGVVEKLTQLRARHTAFVHAIPRGPHATLFVLVADTPGEFEGLDARLTAASQPFETLPLRP